VVKKFIKLLDKDFNFNVKDKPTFTDYHFSQKSSPFGEVALDVALIELVSLDADTLLRLKRVGGPDFSFRVEFLLKNFSNISQSIPKFSIYVDKLYVNLVKIDSTLNYPTDIYDPNDLFYKSIGKYSRLLVSFAEVEGKTRTIGLGDYFTQTALRPLAEKVFRLYDNNMQNDQTYDQVAGLKDIPFTGETYYSYDLTAFTDRFPISVIHQLVEGMYGAAYADDIVSLLSGLPFRISGTAKFISYSVGNPMGFKAS